MSSTAHFCLRPHADDDMQITLMIKTMALLIKTPYDAEADDDDFDEATETPLC